MWRYVLSAFYRPTNSITTSWKGFWRGLSLGLLLIGGGAQAESERTDAGRHIEVIIVTAERQEASIQDTSISITALTGDFIDDFGIRNQDDLQIFIPATTIQPYDATIRGVGRNFRALGGDPGGDLYRWGVLRGPHNGHGTDVLGRGANRNLARAPGHALRAQCGGWRLQYSA